MLQIVKVTDSGYGSRMGRAVNVMSHRKIRMRIVRNGTEKHLKDQTSVDLSLQARHKYHGPNQESYALQSCPDRVEKYSLSLVDGRCPAALQYL